MKRALFFLPAILLLVSCKQTPQWNFEVANTSDIELKDVPVVLGKTQVEEQLGEAASGALVLMDGNQAMPFQLDDLDGDGNWDELIAVVALSAGQTKQLSIKSGEGVEQPVSVQRTNIRMALKTPTEGEFQVVDRADRIQGTATEVTSKHFQYEGPGWENDKIAFRNYFDERNGMDIFGKTTADMILDKIGVGASYHELQPWGMDILKVGNSLGAGAIALLYQDSLYRVTAPQGATFEVVATGPLRSTFDLDFAEVQLADRKVKVKHRISIMAGVYGYKSQVFIEGETSGIQIVSGIVNLHSEEAHFIEAGNMNILYSYDRQSFNEENLGMALMTSDEYYQSWYPTPETGDGVIETFAIVCQPDANGQATFSFLAGWELSDDRFKSQNGFEAYLREEALRQEVVK